MKVKELVEHLTHFNPDAEIEIIANYKEKKITEICWDSGDGYCNGRNIEKEKMNTKKVFLDTDISDKKEKCSMKAKDLMIGDLVYYSYANPFVTKVIDVCSHGEEPFIRCKRDEKDNLYKQDQLEDFHVGILRPIPLTSEILEKNGFTSKEDPYIHKKYFLLGKNEYNYDVYLDGLTILLVDEEYEPATYAYICDVNYVHELQHALKLCKIEKEIVL